MLNKYLTSCLILQIAQTLYLPYIDKVPLFRGCSSEFINQIVSLSIRTVKIETFFFKETQKGYTFVLFTGYKTS